MQHTFKRNIVKHGISTLIGGKILFFLVNEVYASAGVVFSPYTYVNPASMSLVKKFSLTLGGGEFFLNTKFRGTNAGITGKSSANKNSFLPYGQIMYRLAPKWVVGVDVSTPLFYNYFNFKSGPLAGIKAEGLTKNYSPKISYQVTDKLALGIGLDLLQTYGYRITQPLAVDQVLSVKASGFAVGWDAGFLYKIRPTSLLSFDYHSRIIKKLNGTSYLNGQSPTSTHIFQPMPNIISLNFLQIFSKEWLASITSRFIQWSIFKNYLITNSPMGRIQVPMNYRDTWMISGFTRYQFAPQWATFLALEYHANPQPLPYRPALSPADQLIAGSLGIQYMYTKKLQIQLIYGGLGLNPRLKNFNFGTFGKEPLRGQFVDLSFTYKF